MALEVQRKQDKRQRVEIANNMNLSLKIAIASSLDRIGILSAARNYNSSRSGIVLSLHRVLPPGEVKTSFEPAIAMTNSIFEELLLLLHREYRVVSLHQLLRQPQDIDHRQRVALTFDDGWADTYQFAFPLLLRYEMPATVFLCPGLMEQDRVLPEERFARIWNWCAGENHLPNLLQDFKKWGLNGGEAPTRSICSKLLKRFPIDAKLLMLDHLEASYGVPPCKERRFLTWDEVRIMRRDNITFGSHTMRHCALSAEQYPSIEQELRDSRKAIETQLGEEVRVLAYPNGSWDRRVVETARQAGYTHAFTTEEGAFRVSSDPMTIPRLNVDDAAVVGKVPSLHTSRARFYLQHAVYKHP